MIVGIDLGTTNSLLAVWEAGAPRLIPNSLGEVLTPSCVSLDKDGSVLVGRAARERLQTHPDSTAAVFKRLMGSNKLTRLGNRDFRPEELSALILRSLKEDAEAALGQPVTEAVITVPAYFSDAQRKATRAAGQLAGLRVERLLNEPTAAALAYGIHQRGSESKFLVFDLGGGTFDVSLLDLFEGVMEVRASAGDNFLGGEDFVALLVDAFFEAARVPPRLKNDNQFMQRLGAHIESAKRALSTAPSVTVQIDHGDASYSMSLDEAGLERICAPLLQRLREPVERAMRDAGLRSAELDNVVLAGGATRMPVVRRLVARMFGRLPATEINPDEVVALGAAVQAGLKMKDKALDEVVMTDVAPYSLGLETGRRLSATRVSSGHFESIIDRNTIVPVSRMRTFSPLHDEQESIELNVYQGEARMVYDNILLGSLKIALPKLPRAECGIDVRFTYDVNGLLQVEATVQRTGETQSLIITGNPGMLDEAEIAERLAALAALKVHPREKMENRTLLARAERLYQQLRGAARDELGDLTLRFELALDREEPQRIAAHAAAFAGVLDRYDSEKYFHSPDAFH